MLTQNLLVTFIYRNQYLTKMVPRKIFSFVNFLLLSQVFYATNAQLVEIYHDSWIDFNKNGQKDIYEDPAISENERIEDLLSQMNLYEKTAQMVTLYGFGRVLKDELPTPEWKEAFWKDGIGNIDEHLASTTFHPEANTKFSYPYSAHAKSINLMQKWFIEETRFGIPVYFTI